MYNRGKEFNEQDFPYIFSVQASLKRWKIVDYVYRRLKRNVSFKSFNYNL